MQHEAESAKDAVGARQLDLQVPARRTVSGVSGRRAAERRPRTEGPVPLCVVCGRARARLTLNRNHGQAPIRLCLRCHHGVMQQRKMLRAGLAPTRVGGLASAGLARRDSVGDTAERKHQVAGDAGLIVRRDARLSGDAKYATLTHHRRRAQVAARRALESELSSEPDLLPAQGPNLLDRAS